MQLDLEKMTMRWLIVCIFLTSLLSWLVRPGPGQFKEMRLDRSRPISIGPVRPGMTENEVHQVLGRPQDRYDTIEVFSDQPVGEGPWRVIFKNQVAVVLDSGKLIQDGRVLLSNKDDEAKMLRVLGKPDEEEHQDEVRYCRYRIGNSLVAVALGGYSNLPNAVISISASLAP